MASSRRRRRRRRSSERRSSELSGASPFEWIKLRKIHDPEENKYPVDYDHVRNIAASYPLVGFLHPIVVQRVYFERDGKTLSRFVVVAGRALLAAAHHLGLEGIWCKVVDGDEAFVNRVRVAENLFRKPLSVLAYHKLLLEWADLTRETRFSGQNETKSMRRGRPRGGDAELARKMPYGGTFHAWKNRLSRARKMAKITPEAEAALIDHELDNNQTVLLDIAEGSGAKAQLKKVAGWVARLAGDEALSGEPKEANEPVSDNPEARTMAALKAPRERRTEDPTSPQHEPTFEELKAAWHKHLREAWKYTPHVEREKFLSMLRRARCRAKTDVASLVRDAFCGRKHVLAQHLFALGKARGIRAKDVRGVLRLNGYKRTRESLGSARRWMYRNPNLDWRDEIPIPEFAEPQHVSGTDPRAGKTSKVIESGADDYFADLDQGS